MSRVVFFTFVTLLSKLAIKGAPTLDGHSVGCPGRAIEDDCGEKHGKTGFSLLRLPPFPLLFFSSGSSWKAKALFSLLLVGVVDGDLAFALESTANQLIGLPDVSLCRHVLVRGRFLPGGHAGFGGCQSAWCSSQFSYCCHF